MEEFDIENEFLKAVEEAGLMTGAWTGVPFKDFPESVQEKIKKVVFKLHSDWQDS